MSASFCASLNPFNFIRKHFLQILVRKVAVPGYKVLVVMSTSGSTGLTPFNFIRKLRSLSAQRLSERNYIY
jgi:hypothetical protein